MLILELLEDPEPLPDPAPPPDPDPEPDPLLVPVIVGGVEFEDIEFPEQPVEETTQQSTANTVTNCKKARFAQTLHVGFGEK
jgi:hypothetical protein